MGGSGIGAPPLGPPPSAPKKTWGRKQKIKKPEGRSLAIFEPENPFLPPLVLLCIAFLEEKGLFFFFFFFFFFFILFFFYYF